MDGALCLMMVSRLALRGGGRDLVLIEKQLRSRCQSVNGGRDCFQLLRADAFVHLRHDGLQLHRLFPHLSESGVVIRRCRFMRRAHRAFRGRIVSHEERGGEQEGRRKVDYRVWFHEIGVWFRVRDIAERQMRCR